MHQHRIVRWKTLSQAAYRAAQYKCSYCLNVFESLDNPWHLCLESDAIHNKKPCPECNTLNGEYIGMMANILASDIQLKENLK